MAYDTRGYMTTQIDSGSSGAVSTIVDTYDPGGRKTNQLRDGVTSTFTMDNVGRLTLQNRGGNLSSFAYDNVGHLTLKHNAGDSAVTMNRNLLGQVTTYMDGSTLCTNTWDVKGNLTNENIGGVLTTFGWDQENRMTSRTHGVNALNFVYDESHHLRYEFNPASEDEGVSFNYLDDVVFARYDTLFGTRLEQMTAWQGQNLANASLDFLIDPLGSFVGKTSSTGVGDLVAFFPYGEIEDPNGARPPSNDWQFVGSYGVYAFSEFLKLMWHRWYDANAGSFRSVDPLWPRESAYGYVNGMPQMMVDWEGLQAPQVTYSECIFEGTTRYLLTERQACILCQQTKRKKTRAQAERICTNVRDTRLGPAPPRVPRKSSTPGYVDPPRGVEIIVGICNQFLPSSAGFLVDASTNANATLCATTLKKLEKLWASLCEDETPGRDKYPNTPPQYWDSYCAYLDDAINRWKVFCQSV